MSESRGDGCHKGEAGIQERSRENDMKETGRRENEWRGLGEADTFWSRENLRPKGLCAKNSPKIVSSFHRGKGGLINQHS